MAFSREKPETSLLTKVGIKDETRPLSNLNLFFAYYPVTFHWEETKIQRSHQWQAGIGIDLGSYLFTGSISGEQTLRNWQFKIESKVTPGIKMGMGFRQVNSKLSNFYLEVSLDGFLLSQV